MYVDDPTCNVEYKYKYETNSTMPLKPFTKHLERKKWHCNAGYIFTQAEGYKKAQIGKHLIEHLQTFKFPYFVEKA